jgi:hypothetical protein
MRLAVKLGIVFYLFLMVVADTSFGYNFSLFMFCGLLFVQMVILPQIAWNKKQQKNGS